MDPEKIVEHFGGVKETADQLDVTDKAVYQWLAAKRVPIMRQYQIQALTLGKFRAAEKRA